MVYMRNRCVLDVQLSGVAEVLSFYMQVGGVARWGWEDVARTGCVSSKLW